MITAIALLLSLIFLALTILHLAWATGSTFGLAVALPTDESGVRVLNPGKVDCIVVALGLVSFSLFYLLRSGLVGFALPALLIAIASWLIPSIFMLRAIGDFRYVGLFKKVRQTPFGRMDTRFYVPLCVLIGAIGFWLI